MAWNDPKEMADYCYTIDEPDMAEEILKLGTRIEQLQKQLTEANRTKDQLLIAANIWEDRYKAAIKGDDDE